MQRRITTSSHVLRRGFTIVELLVIVVVLGVLMGIAVDSVTGYQSGARDRERKSDVGVIAQSLERYYRTQAVAVGPTYPPSSIDEDDFTELINDPEATNAPDDAGTSMVIASTPGNQSPATNEYIYQALNVNGSPCMATPCVKYKLYYKLEKTGATVVQNSLRQQ